MAELKEQIAELESENVGQKSWTLMGEADARGRPQNSLLEEDLEFERNMKPTPVITEEAVHSLEELIKARILENRYDDVVRIRAVDDKPFLPSRLLELNDSKSQQSLAQIYENDYMAAQTDGPAIDDRDGKLKKEHDEIEEQWDSICNKLDALSNAHYVPKQVSYLQSRPLATLTFSSAQISHFFCIKCLDGHYRVGSSYHEVCRVDVGSRGSVRRRKLAASSPNGTHTCREACSACEGQESQAETTRHSGKDGRQGCEVNEFRKCQEAEAGCLGQHSEAWEGCHRGRESGEGFEGAGQAAQKIMSACYSCIVYHCSHHSIAIICCLDSFAAPVDRRLILHCEAVLAPDHL